MTISTRTKHWGTAAAVSAVLLTLGCSGGSSEGSVTDTLSATPSSLASNDKLLLSSNEFPSGTIKVELTQEAVAAGFSNATGISNYKVDGPITVTPAQCEHVQEDLAAQQRLLQKASFTGVQQVDGTVITEIVSGTTADLDKISDLANSCGQMTLTTTVLGKQLASTTVTIEKLPLPGATNGVPAIAYHTTSQSSVAGKSVSTSSYTGCAVIGGTTVAVHAENPSGQADQNDFDRIFGTAVQKVRNAI